MSRTPNATDALISDLQKRLEKIVEAAREEGRSQALAEIRSLVGGGGAPAAAARAPRAAKAAAPKAASTTKSGAKRKNPWAGLSDEDRLARVNAIRKGRGLPLKSKL